MAGLQKRMQSAICFPSGVYGITYLSWRRNWWNWLWERGVLQIWKFVAKATEELILKLQFACLQCSSGFEAPCANSLVKTVLNTKKYRMTDGWFKLYGWYLSERRFERDQMLAQTATWAAENQSRGQHSRLSRTSKPLSEWLCEQLKEVVSNARPNLNEGETCGLNCKFQCIFAKKSDVYEQLTEHPPTGHRLQ
jgi:hypothetical protein